MVRLKHILEHIVRPSFSRPGLLLAMLCILPLCTKVNEPGPLPPYVTAQLDTTVYVNDTVTVHALAGAGNGPAVRYIWEDSLFRGAPDTIDDTMIRAVFAPADTGEHAITIRAWDKATGLFSPVERITIRVLSGTPAVTAMDDTSVLACDSFAVRAAARDTNGTIIAFRWTVDSAPACVSTNAGALRLWFPTHDTGVHLIRVCAVDDDGLSSGFDTTSVRVKAYKPYIAIVSDTAVTVGDPFTLTAADQDTVGKIREYLWTAPGDSAPVATQLPRRSFVVRDTGLFAVIVRAIATDSVISLPDTALVHVREYRPDFTGLTDTAVFIHVPLTIRMLSADTVRTIAGYRWSVDNRTAQTWTVSAVATVVFGLADTGVRTIAVQVVRADGIASVRDSMTVTVRAHTPRVTAMDDTAVSANTPVVLHAVAADSGRVTAFEWDFGSGTLPKTVYDSTLVMSWSIVDTGVHTITVRVFNDDSVWSARDTVFVTVHPYPPRATAMDDTTVAVQDTVVLRAAAVDSNGVVRRFAWAVHGAVFSDTTAVGAIAAAWAAGDTGAHTVLVKVQDNDGLWSEPDTIIVTVGQYPPTVLAMDDTTVAVCDTVVLHASGSDANGPIRHYVWALDGAAYSDTTTAGTIRTSWPVQAAGVHMVLVRAIDEDGITSPPDSVRIDVKLLPPTLSVPRDTLLHRFDTLPVQITASDSNGPIIRYLWSWGDTAWNDSASQPSQRIYYRGHDTMNVRVGVRDGDGILTADSFTVYFKRPLVFLSVTDPIPDTAFVVTRDEWSVQGGSARFVMNAVDTTGNGGWGLFQYIIYVNKDSSAIMQYAGYRGVDTVVTLALLDTGRFFWRMSANNRDDTAWASGSFRITLQKRLGFAGHSIAVGFAGDSGTGGFRRMVIDSLRKHRGGDSAVTCTGPLTTGYLLPAADDYSLAKNGSKAWGTIDTLYQHPECAADIWVVMSGVNGNYQYWEEIDVIALIDSLHLRNPMASLYVLNGLPLPPAYDPTWIDPASLARFNRNILTAVSRRQTYGWKISLVDANRAMLPAGAFDPSLFPPSEVTANRPLHPTQQGYDLIAKEILKTMEQAGEW